MNWRGPSRGPRLFLLLVAAFTLLPGRSAAAPVRAVGPGASLTYVLIRQAEVAERDSAVASADSPPAKDAAGAVESAAGAAYDAFLGLTADQIETFLQEARVVAVTEVGSGVTKPLRATLDDGRVRHDAEIQNIDKCEETDVVGGPGPVIQCDSYKYNIAAYEMGRLLGLTSIPPSVQRTFDGRGAAFTWWIEDAQTLAKMEMSGLWQPSMEEWKRQEGTVVIFDELIFNTDRHQANLLMDPLRRVWMIDHTRCFRTETHLRNPERLEELRIDRSLLARLRDLDEGALQRCCAAYLSGEERADVLVRRDSILALFQ